MEKEKISMRVIGAILATGLMSFCGVVVETAMNITFPTLMKDFDLATTEVQWMTTIYLLVVAIIIPLSAILKKSFKIKQLFLIANFLFLIGIGMDAIATSFPILLTGRVAQGIGTGIALPLMFNIILEQVPISKIGTMMGIGTLITAVAPAVGPVFGGMVITHLNWRYIFILLLPILIVALFLGVLTIDQKEKVKRTKLDILSFAMIILMFTGFIFGFSNMGNHAFLSISVSGAFISGLLGMIILILRSHKISDPIIDLRILKNANFSGHVAAFFILQMIALGLAFILPNYIQLVNGQTAITAGIVLLPGAVIGAIFAPLSGRILDHFGAAKPILTGSFFMSLALLTFYLLSLHLKDSIISLIYLLFMMGIGLSFGNVMTSGLKKLAYEQQADGNAMLTTLQQFAGAMGTSVVSAIIGQSQKTLGKDISISTAVGSQHAFILLLVLGVLEFFILIRVVGRGSSRN